MESMFEYNYLGKSGLKVSNMCLGTSIFGQTSGDILVDEENSVKLLDRFVEMGGNFVDTSDQYCRGQSEKVVGNWLSGKERERIVINTKVGMPIDKTNPNSRALNRKHVMHSIEKSLKNLHTNYVDMYMTHFPDNSTPLEEVLRTLNDLVRAGKVHHIGVSNYTGYQLQKVVDYCRFMGLDPVVNIQSEYSLLARELEQEVFHVCREEGISLTPWGALRGGWLTGKYERGSTPPEGSRIAWSTNNKINTIIAPMWQRYENDEQCWGVIDTLKKFGQETEKTPAQVALRWCLQKDIIPSVIIGAKSLKQLEDNVVAAKGWSLTDEQMNVLDEISQYQVPPMYHTAGLQNTVRTPWK